MAWTRALRVPAVLLVVTACSTPPPSPPPPEPAPAVEVTDPRLALRPVLWHALPSLVDDGDLASLRQALERNLTWLARQSAGRAFTYGPRQVTAAELAGALERLAAFLDEEPTPGRLAARLHEDFDVYSADQLPRGDEVLVTGYYVPVIEASLRRRKGYDVPVYGPPRDLFRIDLSEFSDRFEGVRVTGLLSGNRLLPYPDRREIRETRRLSGREIAWARDRVDLFFVEIQGSGVLLLPDGREVRIGYAGANGREYRAIGKLLIEQGKLEREKVSMQSIRRYLAEHPEEVDEVLDYNESVVFFRRLEGPAVGSLGVPVTARRSIATDARLFPPGALAYLVTEVPAMAEDGSTVSAGPLARLVLNQDTGGAIRGTGRVDFFWGRGDEAALRAGLMKQRGALYFLVPKAP